VSELPLRVSQERPQLGGWIELGPSTGGTVQHSHGAPFNVKTSTLWSWALFNIDHHKKIISVLICLRECPNRTAPNRRKERTREVERPQNEDCKPNANEREVANQPSGNNTDSIGKNGRSEDLNLRPLVSHQLGVAQLLDAGDTVVQSPVRPLHPAGVVPSPAAQLRSHGTASGVSCGEVGQLRDVLL
jgi:hypothetical protein